MIEVVLVDPVFGWWIRVELGRHIRGRDFVVAEGEQATRMLTSLNHDYSWGMAS